MLSSLKTPKSFVLFLILSSCATTPPAPTTARVDLKWEFCDVGPGKAPKACLGEEDVTKLREALIRCETK